MYLPRPLISHLYLNLVRAHHSLAPPVLILVALDPDALCACRMLTALLKRDYIGHKIQPISGYDDLARAGETIVSPMKTTNGGSGGLVVCLGVGGLVDMSAVLDLEDEGNGVDAVGGVEVWLFDARRPWNLGNIFGGDPQNLPGTRPATSIQDRGRLTANHKAGHGGIIVYDDGDIEAELIAEREAYCTLLEMGDVDNESSPSDDEQESEPEQQVDPGADSDEHADDGLDLNGANSRKRRSSDSPLHEAQDRRRRRTESVSAVVFFDNLAG